MCYLIFFCVLDLFLFLQKFSDMILIADCGSTKAEWVLLDGEKIARRLTTDGFNPNFCDMDLISSVTLYNVCQNIDVKSITNVYFYGTGCGNSSNVERMKEVLSGIFVFSEIEVFSDILGSCHSLFGNGQGIAGILGTGSNACLYNGRDIEKNAVSLGYLLGDEGSGCHIGKKIVRDYFYGIMPDDLRKNFVLEYNIDRNTLIDNVYKHSQPSKYLASFSKFAHKNVENQYIVDLVSGCFDEFINCFIIPLTENGKYHDVGFIGSVAFYFQDILRERLSQHGLRCGKIVKNPMDGLVRFYS